MNENVKLIKGDGRVLSMLPDASIDCIITDHPWLDKLSNKGGNIKERFAEEKESGMYERKMTG